MDFKAIIEEVKSNVTGGGILECELSDEQFGKIINASFREIQRYIDDTRLMTVPYSSCIDLSDKSISAVVRVYRAVGYMAGDASAREEGLPADPMYMAQWQLFSGPGSMYNIDNFAMNYGAWNTALQIKNTVSTDLIFRYERYNSKLYINCPYDKPQSITIEYVPRYNNVDEIKSDFWIDNLLQLAIAQAKIALGRLRTRFTQDNALWKQDGETILAEGQEELKTIREKLDAASQLCYPVD